jgi:lysophospholipase L1-like esterase
MKLTPLICLGLGICCATGRAQSVMAPDERAVWDMELAWNKAYVDGDETKATELESPNYVFTGADGRVRARPAVIAEMETGGRFQEMSLHEATVHITGDTAIVTGRLVVARDGPHGVAEIDASTDTLVKIKGAWVAVATSEIPVAGTAQSSVTPLWRDGGNWLTRHQQFVDDAQKGGVDLLFVGDSITDFWRNRGKVVWDQYFAQDHAANIGISGDRTQHLLWRLDHGEIDRLKPKAVVLMIGTNNTGFERDGVTPRNTTAETVEGIAAVVNDLRQKLPDAKILLLAVFPRSHLASDPARIQVNQINRAIAGLDDGAHVRYLDLGPLFLTADGTLEADIMPDFLHPSVKGYGIWAEAIKAPVAQMLSPQG